MKKHKIVSSWICYTLIQFECFPSFRYARRVSEITVNDRLSAAALISFSMLRLQRLLGSGAYFNYGWNTKGNIERITSWARKITITPRTVIWTKFRKFPYIKTLELTSGSWSCLSSDMVLIPFYIKRRNKSNQISAAGLIPERCLFE